tara:strand:- start:21 stop:263 length:243 start_codon:yes stop_codon:yes gene_type:complete
MTSEWDNAKMQLAYGWIRKLVSVGGWPHKYIYSYYNDKGYLSPLSNGEWKYTPKNIDVKYVYGHPGERSDNLEYLMKRYA